MYPHKHISVCVCSSHIRRQKDFWGEVRGGAGICRDRMEDAAEEELTRRGEGWFPREAAAVYKLPTMSVDSGWRFSRLPSIPLRIVSSEQSADARAHDTEVAFDINVVLLSPLKSNPSPTRQRASSLLSLSIPPSILSFYVPYMQWVSRLPPFLSERAKCSFVSRW